MATQQLKEGDRVSEWDLYQQNHNKKYKNDIPLTIIKEDNNFVYKVQWKWLSGTPNGHGYDIKHNQITYDVKISKQKQWKIKTLK